MAAAAVVLSGCATDNGNDQETATTSPAVSEAPASPWDVPLEQRPALFDPCEEIPIEAVEEAAGGSVQPVEEFTRHEPGSLMVCGWSSDEAQFSVLATWKTRDEYLSDRMFTVRDTEVEIAGRSGLRLSTAHDSLQSTCLQLFFTSRGTVWLEFDLVNTFNEFKGDRVSDACAVINEVVDPLIGFVPEGDFS